MRVTWPSQVGPLNRESALENSLCPVLTSARPVAIVCSMGPPYLSDLLLILGTLLLVGVSGWVLSLARRRQSKKEEDKLVSEFRDRIVQLKGKGPYSKRSS
jgi:hypothetical protein